MFMFAHTHIFPYSWSRNVDIALPCLDKFPFSFFICLFTVNSVLLKKTHFMIFLYLKCSFLCWVRKNIKVLKQVKLCPKRQNAMKHRAGLAEGDGMKGVPQLSWGWEVKPGHKRQVPGVRNRREEPVSLPSSVIRFLLLDRPKGRSFPAGRTFPQTLLPCNQLRTVVGQNKALCL